MDELVLDGGEGDRGVVGGVERVVGMGIGEWGEMLRRLCRMLRGLCGWL